MISQYYVKKMSCETHIDGLVQDCGTALHLAIDIIYKMHNVSFCVHFEHSFFFS